MSYNLLIKKVIVFSYFCNCVCVCRTWLACEHAGFPSDTFHTQAAADALFSGAVGGLGGGGGSKHATCPSLPGWHKHKNLCRRNNLNHWWTCLVQNIYLQSIKFLWTFPGEFERVGYFRLISWLYIHHINIFLIQ